MGPALGNDTVAALKKAVKQKKQANSGYDTSNYKDFTVLCRTVNQGGCTKRQWKCVEAGTSSRVHWNNPCIICHRESPECSCPSQGRGRVVHGGGSLSGAATDRFWRDFFLFFEQKRNLSRYLLHLHGLQELRLTINFAFWRQIFKGLWIKQISIGANWVSQMRLALVLAL